MTVDPRFLNPTFDPGNQHSVPYLWGTSGLYRRGKASRPEDDSWALVFDPQRQPGPFLLLEDPRFTIGAALHFLGYRLNSTDPSG